MRCVLLPLRPAVQRPLALAVLLALGAGHAPGAEEAPSDPFAAVASALELRGIGPAVMGGRIADIAVDPRDAATWFVAAGSGGVWKTVNAGTTWTSIFDGQGSYSIGAVALDPSNPDVVWVGTGENVSGRHVGWGDGVYRSRDGGDTWKNMGLGRSEHIGRIEVDPRDGDVVWVAAEGPLWSAGGERGLYKTTDGGATWTRSLAIDDDTGVTDVRLDPRDPDVVYAASYQRRRTVWSLLAGGPGSGLWKSTDGGTAWRRLEAGLPEGDKGKIGLAISPADPDVVYATIEADEDGRGFYRSRDRGESWDKRNGYISNGTGPHYYQEIVASPHDLDTVYQMDVFLHVTRDGGASFEVLGNGREKHSDNHVLVVDPARGGHLLAGTDGGLYESFDEGATWRHIGNLPISQLYKVAVSDALPFYTVLAGAQDLGTLVGPSRTAEAEGVRDAHWRVPLGADGYDCAFDPEDPELLYAEIQVGSLHRIDLRTGEALDIQPEPEPGEPAERWNWDAPIEVSPHDPARLWFGSHRLWRSDDRGDSWTAVSGDLTRGGVRYELPVGGRVRSVDGLYDNGAMSWYATLTSVSESPLVPGLLYTGSDDGLVHVSEDAGATWRPTRPAGVPERAFVNEVKASVADPDTVFVAFDNHKEGDYRPLPFVSRDRGRTWRSIAGDLPAGAVVWSLEQDDRVPSLLFAGTEGGLFASPDGGGRWVELGGVPTISFRDLEIQRREGDLVAASFGRGIFVLDDLGPLRETARGIAGPAHLFAPRNAWSYIPSVPFQAAGKPSQGSADFEAPNPPFGAVVGYWLEQEAKSHRGERREAERAIADGGGDVPFPGWDRLREEDLEGDPEVVLTVREADGRAVRRLAAPGGAGFHRVAWDLRAPPPDPVDLEPPGFRPPWASDPQGPLAAPGEYTVELARVHEGAVERLAGPVALRVATLPGGSGGVDLAAVAAFQADTAELVRRLQGAAAELERGKDRLRHLRAAIVETPAAPDDALSRLEALEAELAGHRRELVGDPVLGRFEEPQPPSILRRAGGVAGGHWQTRQPPTATQRRSLAIAEAAWADLRSRLTATLETLAQLERDLEAAGAPFTPGREVPPAR